ncbi:choice-of-anchor J domain-containing protein [Porphyromonas gingivalis]|uniref:choice-of-anchor J domain-containing protein n=1 Tax=Porphyromonas gingivalis TaxID=837 RepID=UPI0027BA9854|nr:choice-of-anchor J domain-containing protein [Porphyromonas gingivalis]
MTGLTATQDGMDVVLRWMAPGEEDETVLLEEGFESGIPAAWTTIDADGDGNDWTTTPPPGGNSFAGHNGGATASSASYINNVGTQTPDNYLVTPSLNLANGGTLTFWVCAQDAGYAAEHYAVYASTGGNAATDFVNPLMEETLTAKSEVLYPEAVRGSRTQGTWYQKTVQLPAGTKYVAFRHFDCTDQFWLNVDDVKISEDGGGGSNNPLDYTYTVYRDGSKIKEDLTATTYTDAGMASSNYEYCVEVVSPSGVSPKVCINYNDLNDVVAAKPYTITVVDKTITVTCEGEAMIYDMMGRRLAAGCNTVVYTAQDGLYAAMIVVDGKSYVEKLAIN